MKIGFLGGTFDPPHKGHTAAAALAARRLDLDLLLFIPTARPPHKELPPDTAGTEHRLEMTRLAASGLAEAGALVSDIEIRRGGKSYTADTAAELMAAYPGAELWLICGGDMFRSLPQWRRSGWLAENLNFAVFSRGAEEAGELERLAGDYLRRYGIRARYIDAEPVPISSTQLRALLKRGEGGAYLDRAVYAYILERRLYGARPEPDALWELARPWIGEGRLEHVAGCRETAARLAERWGADVREAEVAAILHDLTKKFDAEEQLLLCAKYDITIENFDPAYESLLHAETGAALACRLFGISEAEREAIRWHTTGRAGMSLLEKIIYLADTIEPARSFEGAGELRRLAFEDLDGAMIRSLEMSLEHIRRRGKKPHPSSEEALAFLLRDRSAAPD
jgi:nicotinate-nucleotide adenylyltransferase